MSKSAEESLRGRGEITTKKGWPAELSEELCFGLDVVHDVKDADADIVFVHGLDGDRTESWTYRDGEGACFWPRDLLSKDIAGARISSWGYNSSTAVRELQLGFGKRVVKALAGSLCRDLKTIRHPDSQHDRNEYDHPPIIFIALGFGGLICKAAMLVEGDAGLPKHVSGSTHGIIFFGTPHTSSIEDQWAAITLDVTLELEQAEEDVPIWAGLHFRFSEAIEERKHQGRPLKIECAYHRRLMARMDQGIFWETIEMKIYGGDGVPCENPFVAKFADANDLAYQKVSEYLWAWVLKDKCSRVYSIGCDSLSDTGATTGWSVDEDLDFGGDQELEAVLGDSGDIGFGDGDFVRTTVRGTQEATEISIEVAGGSGPMTGSLIA